MCLKFYFRPIVMCLNGHSICMDCSAQACPLCGVPLNPSFRNITLEQVLEQISLPCRFPQCFAVVPLSEYNSHCTSCEYSTRCAECSAEPADLRDHLVTVHKFKHFAMPLAGGVRLFSGPYSCWTTNTTWPKGIWSFGPHSVVAQARTEDGTFALSLYRLTHPSFKVRLKLQSDEHSISHCLSVPHVSSGQRDALRLECSVSTLLHRFAQAEGNILTLCVNVKYC